VDGADADLVESLEEVLGDVDGLLEALNLIFTHDGVDWMVVAEDLEELMMEAMTDKLGAGGVGR
jgi:hypothetical protein